jgi:hypothetical protein
VNPDRLAALEEERDFLLRSLADLDREHDAGDVTDDDYATLSDDYTARAADVLRTIEEGRTALPRKRPLDLRRLMALLSVTVIAVVAISWWLTRSAERDDATSAAQTVADLCPPTTKDINTLLVDARTALSTDAGCALELFKTVLQQEPDNPEALTYAGWVIAFDAMSTGIQGDELALRGQQALTLIDLAREANPAYVDAQCFTAIIRYRFLDDAPGAAEPLAKCRAGDLPADVAPLVTQLGAKIDAALAGTADTAP